MGASKDKRVQSRSLFYNKAVKGFKSFDVEINGDRPGDIKVKNDNFYFGMFKFKIGLNRRSLGESYMNGDWTCDDLMTFFEKSIPSPYTFAKIPMAINTVVESLPLLAFNMQSKKECKRDISKHYDIGNDLFSLMLDRSMNYSCGYWPKNLYLNSTAANLQVGAVEQPLNTMCETVDEAQMNKMLLIARKLHLKPGMRVLDIGCGWGYLAKFLATNFDVHVLGITISKEQFQWATTHDLKMEELDFLRVPGLKPKGHGSFEFKLLDYRDVKETFDRIVSVGMLEHVGKKNYDEYFSIGHRCLKDDGLFLVQTIGIAQKYMPQVEPWTNTYIFPGGMAPYPRQLVKATFGEFVIEDWHNLGINYHYTLEAWNKNFQKAWPQLEAKYGERFKRMWDYFLISSSALFKLRKLQNWQVVFSKDGFKGGYVSYR